MATHLLPAIKAVSQSERFVLGMLDDRGTGEAGSPKLQAEPSHACCFAGIPIS